jgi:methionyl-tRNA formyltransferase
MRKIRIGYLADGPWSHATFKKLIKDDTIEIKFIVARLNTKDQTLKNFASKYEINYYCNIKINSSEFLAIVFDFKLDLLVSMSFNQIFRQPLLNIPKLGTINCHSGKLPFYRGRNILNWVLINDEKEFGITVHYVNEGIDTGDIIKQKCFPITDFDDYNSLLNIAYVECAEILYSSIKEIQMRVSKRIKQESIHPIGFYCSRRVDGDEIINWNCTSREIFNFIRAITYPGPVARTFNSGKEVKINKSNYIKDAPIYIGTVGQVLSKTEKGFLIKTKDSFIEVFDIEGKLRVGDKLQLCKK